ncbi:Ssb-c31ap [Homalodisca vitripennis]|nr:Ssb-c31ap [Homalodisca vitripennis]
MPKDKAQKKRKDEDSDSDSGPEDRGPDTKKLKKDRDDIDSFHIDGMKYLKVRTFKGKVLIDIREYYESGGDIRPGKKGSHIVPQFRIIIKALRYKPDIIAGNSAVQTVTSVLQAGFPKLLPAYNYCINHQLPLLGQHSALCADHNLTCVPSLSVTVILNQVMDRDFELGGEESDNLDNDVDHRNPSWASSTQDSHHVEFTGENRFEVPVPSISLSAAQWKKVVGLVDQVEEALKKV